MIDEPPRQPDTVDAELSSIDMGALAQRLRPTASSMALVFWWGIFFALIAACFYPSTLAVSAVWLFVFLLFANREVRRRIFLRNLDGLPCLSGDAALDAQQDWPKVTVVVPARDEEATLEEAAHSLVTLPYPNLDIWFVNDHSTDRTRQILDTIQREFPQVHVMHDPPVNAEWFGKSNALWQAFLLIDRERETNAARSDRDWLLFGDADVVFAPGVLQQAVAVAERDQLDFLTCMPHLIAKSWAEQLLLPTGWRGIVQGAHYDRLNDPKSFPIGIGAFMLVKYSTYQGFGGHKALGQWHPEDTLMAAAVKQIGGRVGFAWTPDLLRVRFYNGYRDVKNNTLRKMRIFFGEHIHLPLTMMALRLSTTLMALPMIAAGILQQLVAGGFDLTLTFLSLAGVVLYVDEAREYKGIERIAEFHPLAPWLHPVSGVLRVWFALSLIGQIVTNKPMEWRGRKEFGTNTDAHE